MGGSQWPVGIAQQLAGDKDRVRLSGPDDLLGLNWGSDHPNRACHDSSFLTNPLSKRRLVARTGAIDCARSHPPSTQSVAEMRTNNGAPFGHEDRTAATTSRHNRVRFSNDPPYASSR